MSIYGNVSTATASVGANTNAVTISGLDLTIVSPGMELYLGARDRTAGDGYLIASVAPTGTSGGSITLAGTVPTAYTNAPFLIDSTGYLGTDSSYAATVSLKLLDTLNKLFSPSTNLFSGARQLILDKVASTGLSRFGFSIANRAWADIAQRAFTFTPTGGQATSIETLALRALPDGVTPVDALLVDLTNGTGDLRKGSATMVSATLTDLGSAPMGKVALTGNATITSFGPGRHLERLVHVVDGGGTLTHNAASLNLLTGASIVMRAGDRFHATSDGSGNWRVFSYHRADGTPLALPTSTLRASFRNRIRNGGFSINQRAVSGAVNLSAGFYGHDGWKAGAGGCAYSVSSSTANITSGSLQQVIEGGLYLPEGGTYVLSWAGTAQARVNGGTYAPSPIVVTGLGANANATVEFGTGTFGLVQFEPGSTVTPFEYRDDELDRCQRYYAQEYIAIGNFFLAAGNTWAWQIQLPAVMRATPTLNASSNAAGTISFLIRSTRLFTVQLASTYNGQDNSLAFTYMASAEL